MVKAPVAGRSKTRLARDIGVGAATSFARHSARITVLRLARDPRWQTVLAVTPDTETASARWPGGLATIGQGAGDLGQRMQAVFARMPPGPVIIVGTDIPAVRPGEVARAFRTLGGRDAVFGPARDGGYWLVGLKRRPRLPAAFANVRWSTMHALADTLANLENLAVGFTATHRDVDQVDDVRRLAGLAGRAVINAQSILEPEAEA